MTLNNAVNFPGVQGKKNPGRTKYEHKKLPESDYAIPGYDGKGRSDLVQVRILPGYARMASEIMAERKFPFKTAGDLYRFCIAYGLDHLTSVEPPGFNIMGYIQMEQRTIRDQIYMREQSQTLDSLEELVKHHASQENHMNKLYAKALVEDAIEHAKRVGDTTFRRNTLTKIRKRFKHIIEMKVELPSRVTVNPENYERNEEDEEGEDGSDA